MGTLKGQQRTQNLGRQWDSAENSGHAPHSIPNPKWASAFTEHRKSESARAAVRTNPRAETSRH